MIQIDADTFYKRLSYVASGAMQRAGDMYQKVCLERGDSGTFFRSFNQVAHTMAVIDDEGGDPYRLLFDPDPLLGAVKRVEGELTIQPSPNCIKVSGPVEVEHPCFTGEDFIDFPTPESDPVQVEGGENLSEAIQQAENTVDPSAPNQRFAGVYLGDRHTPGTVCCVGANTTSLVEVEMGDSSEAEQFEGETILPAQSLDQIRTLLESDEDVNLYLESRKVFFVTAKGAVVTRLVAEKYPNYPSIMPDEGNCQEVTMGTDKLETALRVCQEYTEDFSAVLLDFSSDKLVVSAAEAEGGTASLDVPVDTPNMGRMRLKGSADRFLEVVSSMEGNEMDMLVPIEEEPTRVGITGEQEGVTGAVALMMIQPEEELQGK